MSQMWQTSVGRRRATDEGFRIVRPNGEPRQQQKTEVVVFKLPTNNQPASSNPRLHSCSVVAGNCSCDLGVQETKIHEFLKNLERVGELLQEICPVTWQKFYCGVSIPLEETGTKVKFKLFDNVASVEVGNGNQLSRMAAVAFGVEVGTVRQPEVQHAEIQQPQQQRRDREALPTPSSSIISPPQQPPEVVPTPSSSIIRPPPVVPTSLPMEPIINDQSLPVEHREDLPSTDKKKMPPPCEPKRRRLIKRKAKEATRKANKRLLELMEDVTSIDGQSNSEWQPSSDDEEYGRNYQRPMYPIPYRQKRVPRSSQKRQRHD